MDPRRFDSLTRALAAPRTRRGLLAGIGAVLIGARAAAQSDCLPGQTRNRKGECRCPAGTDACPNGCADRKRDPTNCGRCDVVCAAGAACNKGECRCPSGAAPCDGVCRTPASFADDPLNYRTAVPAPPGPRHGVRIEPPPRPRPVPGMASASNRRPGSARG